MTDRWNETLRCSQCSNTGTASLSHFAGAEIPTVDAVNGGFKVMQTKYGPSFHCMTCDIPALP